VFVEHARGMGEGGFRGDRTVGGRAAASELIKEDEAPRLRHWGERFQQGLVVETRTAMEDQRRWPATHHRHESLSRWGRYLARAWRGHVAPHAQQPPLDAA
jgi:hypothetical protein